MSGGVVGCLGKMPKMDQASNSVPKMRLEWHHRSVQDSEVDPSVFHLGLTS